MKRIKLGLGLFLLLSGAIFFTSGCSKENLDHKLTVVVVADGDVKVANALIRVYAPVDNSFIDWYVYTDESGEAEFEFEKEVVVDLVAAKGSFSGCNFAQVKQGENTVEVEIKPWGSDDNGCPESTP